MKFHLMLLKLRPVAEISQKSKGSYSFGNWLRKIDEKETWVKIGSKRKTISNDFSHQWKASTIKDNKINYSSILDMMCCECLMSWMLKSTSDNF